MSDLEDGIKAGITGATTGASLAGTAAGIAALASQAIPPPFGQLATPIAAALGALIGFFVWLGTSTAKKDAAEHLKKIRAAQAAHAAAWSAAANTGPGLAKAAKTILAQAEKSTRDEFIHAFVFGPGATDAYQTLQAAARQNPAYKPMVDAIYEGVNEMLNNWSNRGKYLASIASSVGFITAIGNMPGDLQGDPFAYLRPPLSDMFGPALAGAGIDISSPATLQILEGQYNVSAAVAALPRTKIGGIPIARRSLGANSGGRIVIDNRAFTVAPYGVASFALLPNAAPSAGWRADKNHGIPLVSRWPFGLDADRFALPPQAAQRQTRQVTSPGPTTSALVPLGLGALLWGLLL